MVFRTELIRGVLAVALVLLGAALVLSGQALPAWLVELLLLLAGSLVGAEVVARWRAGPRMKVVWPVNHGGTIMAAEFIPDEWCRPDAQTLVVAWIRSLPVPVEERKRLVQAWADCAGVELTGKLVAAATGTEAGEV